MLADRSDIGEEISRLKIHSRQVEELLTGGARRSARSWIFCSRR